MSTIRRQSIISSVIVYSGFALGAVNTLLYGRGLAPDEYGLITGIFISVGNIMFAVANPGAVAYISKFYPYYHDHLPARENDLISRALFFSLVCFALVTLGGIVFKPLIIRKFGHNSAELVHYYYWIFPFALGLTLFSVLEAYAWQVKASVVTSYLREFQWRVFNLVLIVLLFLGVLTNFSVFVKSYAFTYLLLALILFFYLYSKGHLHLTFSVSRVTKKFRRKIRALMLLTWSGAVLFNLSFFFAAIVIAAVVPAGLTAVGIFALAQNIASFIQAPQRAIAAASLGPLSRAWKDKDIGRIQRIYSRSSINQVIFSVGMFVLIALNFRDGILTLGFKQDYLAGLPIFLIIGLTRIVDMGTGVNTQIIVTSVYWRFEFISGMILMTLTIPLNYLLARQMGVVGPAIADLVTFSVYNAIRGIFLYRRFNLQPFNRNTIYTLLLGAGTFASGYWLFHRHQGFIWLVLRSTAVIVLYVAGVVLLRLSDDIGPVWNTVKKRLGLAGTRTP
ncbi:MAG TPA: polysaccharide biosynthesis C-terminal domain-containing protein [Puia sp.]|jgi:O-antigen/teichoic acid export membrane protein|nr:polysaccharide biosynthesis C-terminal domain-containing protein [Puia sp.]